VWSSISSPIFAGLVDLLPDRIGRRAASSGPALARASGECDTQRLLHLRSLWFADGTAGPRAPRGFSSPSARASRLAEAFAPLQRHPPGVKVSFTFRAQQGGRRLCGTPGTDLAPPRPRPTLADFAHHGFAGEVQLMARAHLLWRTLHERKQPHELGPHRGNWKPRKVREMGRADRRRLRSHRRQEYELSGLRARHRGEAAAREVREDKADA
jgi:hypothetical protein